MALAATLAPSRSFKVTSFDPNLLLLARSCKEEHMWELIPVSNTHTLDELLEPLKIVKLKKVLPSSILSFPLIDSRNLGQFLFQCPSSYFSLPLFSTFFLPLFLLTPPEVLGTLSLTFLLLLPLFFLVLLEEAIKANSFPFFFIMNSLLGHHKHV